MFLQRRLCTKSLTIFSHQLLRIVSNTSFQFKAILIFNGDLSSEINFSNALVLPFWPQNNNEEFFDNKDFERVFATFFSSVTPRGQGAALFIRL